MEPCCERNPLAQGGRVPASSCYSCQLSTTSDTPGAGSPQPWSEDNPQLFPYTSTKDITGLWIRLIISQYFELRGIYSPLNGQAGL